jgi:Ca2+-transporting ATPase
LGTIWWATDQYGEAVARTMGMTVFSLANIWFALETADPRQSVFSGSVLENPTLLKATGLSIVATIAAVEVGFLNRILGTVGMTMDQWIIAAVVSLAIVVIVEGARLLNIRTEETPSKVVARPSPAAS